MPGKFVVKSQIMSNLSPEPDHDADPKAQLAAAIHAGADLLNSRTVEPQILDEARSLVEQANSLLAAGVARTEEERLLDFASQMVVPLGAPIVEDGTVFEAFLASPFSGKHNALRPTSVSYRSVDGEVHGEVLVGPAFEGAPGRAHGGLTAAIFDDLMGAMQRVTGLSGYTLTLEVTYLAKLPIDEIVMFRAWQVESTDKTFTVDGEAVHDGTTVATARGVFTAMPAERFASQ